MNPDRETLQDHLQDYERQLRGLKSYVQELKAKTAEHDTDSSHFEADLTEAEHNIKYYEGETARIRELLGEESDGPTYFLYQDAAGEWRWRLRAGNQRIIADSGEGYRDKQDCLHAITLVKASQHAAVKEKG